MLYVVGFGCGSYEGMTIEAQRTIENSGLIVGYTAYTELIKKYFPQKESYDTGMRGETQRVRYALEKAAEGVDVALICSGDSEVYGMAGLAYQLSEQYPSVEIQVIAGVTAALSGGALLGSPLTNDFAVISLSDLLTPMEKIIKRIEYAAKADMTIAVYNPSSKNRAEHLKKICAVLNEIIPPETICGYVKNVGRLGCEHGVMTLRELFDFKADMFTTIFIGCSDTRLINGKMVTLRGYKNV